jgi:predicted nucleic acid-binding protein
VALLQRLAADGTELWSSVIVRVEVRAGMRPAETAATDAAFALFHWQDVTSEIADRAGSLATRFHASHSGIDTADFLLAATAEVLGAGLLTLNVRHFPMIDGLQPAYAPRIIASA